MIHQMHHETSDVRTKERTVNIFLDMQKSRKFIILGRKKKKKVGETSQNRQITIFKTALQGRSQHLLRLSFKKKRLAKAN